MKKIGYDIMLIVILIMSIIQAPFIYYYTSGFLALFTVALYLFIGLSLTIWLLMAILRNTKGTMTMFHTVGLALTIFIGCVTLFFGEDIIENLEWKLRRSSREEIVKLVKADKLKPNVVHNNIICTLDDWDFPPISNGGNEIVIYKIEDMVTVEFFIDRGSLDHYSAFVYTNNPEKIKEIEKHIDFQTRSHINKKLDKNWYRVSY